ncbi:hypothetical protein, partial [Lentimonas sp. CC11]|uniref:hypothetical protein n=1 Tax=Lentimonas sp. CC11 TaxID=2676096 RepID=UPI001A7E5ED1
RSKPLRRSATKQTQPRSGLAKPFRQHNLSQRTDRNRFADPLQNKDSARSGLAKPFRQQNLSQRTDRNHFADSATKQRQRP